MNAPTSPPINLPIDLPLDSSSEVHSGLARPAAEIAPKYFYDALGCKLFEAITVLDEYYPTRTEREIFATHAGDMARACGEGTVLVDLGAGNCEKAAGLFGALRPAQYVALDVSVEFVTAAVGRLREQFPALPMLAAQADFSQGLRLPAGLADAPRLFFYPGSSLGNFPPDEAEALLARMHALCAEAGRPGGGVLVGVDLVKPKALLDAAYDDALGVTAAFNLNVLRHLNTLAGTDFNVADWRHVAFYAPEESRIEMHLEARRAVCVRWRDGERRFAQGERILTEYSYKYTLEGIASLLTRAGFEAPHSWTDARDWFAVCHARAGD
jgi:dimethylhistidine N-methyltransferase